MSRHNESLLDLRANLKTVNVRAASREPPSKSQSNHPVHCISAEIPMEVHDSHGSTLKLPWKYMEGVDASEHGFALCGQFALCGKNASSFRAAYRLENFFRSVCTTAAYRC